MPTDSVKLTYSFVQRLLIAAAYTIPIVLLFLHATLTIYIWILISFLAILAVNYWIRFFWPDTILHISEKGVWYLEYQPQWMKWEDILHFRTITDKDPETGTTTHLILRTRQRVTDVTIQLDDLQTNETQIREWIKKYAGTTCPADEGHAIM